MKLNDNEIKQITDKVKSPCLVGRVAFEESVQQYTCKRYNGKNCECHRNYEQALIGNIVPKQP